MKPAAMTHPEKAIMTNSAVALNDCHALLQIGLSKFGLGQKTNTSLIDFHSVDESCRLPKEAGQHGWERLMLSQTCGTSIAHSNQLGFQRPVLRQDAAGGTADFEPGSAPFRD